MTSARRKPSVLGTRRNTIDQEREQFHRNQEASFRKAINEEEVPVKMKHVRNLIIGTHQSKSGSVFWGLVNLSPPLHTDVTTWKFCHTLHLILRDGHPAALHDSIQQIRIVKMMGEHFSHLPAGYGGLIQRYCALLICKLNFHQHYPRFPGTLQVKPDELEAIAENDVNNYFEMAVEMLDYMEKILKLYDGVCDSLDPSRANSMTKMGQCRLSPLIPCIQDSSSLYDFIVRILFKLHKTVQPDMLSGHRTRFCQQFKALQTFYSSTRNLQYFKTLIQVPHLPQVPPNFLIEAELRSHVAPVVVLEEEQPDPSEIQDSVLIDTSDPSPPPVPPHPHPDVVNSHNGPMMEVISERDSLIGALEEELRESRNTIQTLRSENSYMQEQLRLKINDLESTIAELDSELTAEKQSKESILAQVEAAAASAEAVTKLSDEETRRRTAEEKFIKMKEVYQKLRDEHITLIRVKAELEKTLSEERKFLREEQDKNVEKDRNLKRLEAQLIQQSETQQSVDKANKEKASLEEKLLETLKEKEELIVSRDSLQETLSQVKEEMELNIGNMEKERGEFLEETSTLKSNCEEKELEVVALKESLIELKEYLESQLQEMSAEKRKLNEYIEDLMHQKGLLEIEKESIESSLTKQLETMDKQIKIYIKEVDELKGNIEEMTKSRSEAEMVTQSLQINLKETELKLADLEKISVQERNMFENKLSESKKESEGLQEEVNNWKMDLHLLQEEKESLKLEMGSEITSLNTELNEMKGVKSCLETEIDTYKETLKNLENDFSTFKDKSYQEQHHLETELRSVKEEKQNLFDVCDTQETLILDLKKTLKKAEDEASLKQEELSGVIDNLEKNVSTKDEEIGTLENRIENLEVLLMTTKEESRERLSISQQNMEKNIEKCVSSAIDSSITAIAFSLSHFDCEAHSIIKASPEYTLLYKPPIQNVVNPLLSSYKTYSSNITMADQLINSIDQFGYFLASFLLYGKASSHGSPHIDLAENLVNALEELSKDGTELLEAIRSRALNNENIQDFSERLEKTCSLILSCEDRSPSQEDMAVIVEREMEEMNKAIQNAVEKFSKMLEESRAKDTGMQLEVNEGILATCGELMAAVRLLVQRASELQGEIVAAGRGGASPVEFYKRNHRWTEGLISGAKTVAIACQALVNAADDVVMGKGKFEQVIVSSKEIAASSMQLVMASKVKADKESQKMNNLRAAAKAISTLTGTVVATAESCRDKVTEATTLDFSKLTLHSAKRLEMETLVKVLETEKKLETERAKLAELRRHHYQLAGELEGWEEKDIPK